jgi:hypothetical protein
MNEKKFYQVWHDLGWPQSRINQMLGGHPPSRFPDDYVHVADVKADGLRQAVELTTDKGSILSGTDIAWERNKEVKSFHVGNRDTDRGDVIVTPSGQPYRYEGDVFKEIETYERLLVNAASRGNDRAPDEKELTR